jgi:hypothetical protein
MIHIPDFLRRSPDGEDAPIRALSAQNPAKTAQAQVATQRVAELYASVGEPPKPLDNSSLPPSQCKNPNRSDDSK